MAALRAPVVQRMAYPLAGENFREAVRRPAIFPRAGARRDVNVTSSDLLVEPGIAGVREIIDGIDEIRECPDHALAFELPLVARTGREAQQRRAPMSKDNYA